DLAVARPFLPDAVLARLPWQRLGVDLSSQGRVEAVFSSAPRIAQRTELRVSRPAWGDTVSAHDLVAVLDTQGDALRHRGELQIRAEGLLVHGQDAGAQRHTLAFDFDRKPSASKPATNPDASNAFDAHVRLSNQAGVQFALNAALAFDPQTSALRGSLKARLPAQTLPAPLRAYLPAELDTARLALDVDAQGALTGFITHIGDDGLPRFAPKPLASAALEGRALVEARGFRWRQDGLAVQVPALRW
ncbi:hypothetical protein ACQV5M_19775, partial [Leptospira sp. SA-E8]|uniref:hypothetical protein n=1 Tax=Leptospira sp. SA-E8 TaxID=3422259 RepID=UPI003EBB972D